MASFVGRGAGRSGHRLPPSGHGRLDGPAQVSQGRASSFEDLDRAYVEMIRTAAPRTVVRYDLRILRRTIATMLRGEGLAN